MLNTLAMGTASTSYQRGSILWPAVTSAFSKKNPSISKSASTAVVYTRLPILKTEETSIGKYVFEMNGKKELMKRTCTEDSTSAYQLFPYFGGDEAAPHDVHIFIKDL